MNYQPRTTIKGQALADLIAEFTYADITEVVGMARGAEATKVVESRDNEYSALGKEDTE